MANPQQRIIKENSLLKKAMEFLDRNWQVVAIILGIVGIFVWYQALNIEKNVSLDKALQEVSNGIKKTAQNLSPGAIPETPLISQNQETNASPSDVSIPDEFPQQAKRGQGLTHLARQALNEYLSTVKPDVELSREQKIYIEDYLKDQMEGERVATGEKIIFESADIEDGMDNAQDLTPKQISNLTKYANKVPSLREYTSPLR